MTNHPQEFISKPIVSMINLTVSVLLRQSVFAFPDDVLYKGDWLYKGFLKIGNKGNKLIPFGKKSLRKLFCMTTN